MSNRQLKAIIISLCLIALCGCGKEKEIQVASVENIASESTELDEKKSDDQSMETAEDEGNNDENDTQEGDGENFDDTTIEVSEEEQVVEETQQYSAFYGIWIGADKEESGANQKANEAISKGLDGYVFVSSDWANLNSEKWYVVSAGVYFNEADANNALSNVRSNGYKDAYVKYSGEYIGNQNSSGNDEAMNEAFRGVIGDFKLALSGDDNYSDWVMLGLEEVYVDVRLSSSLGYALYDYDGDGDKELIIGEDEGSRTFVWAIYEAYETGDGWNSAVGLVSGGFRDRYYIMEGNRLANEWSAGAEDSGVDFYTVDGSGGKYKEASGPSDYVDRCIKLNLQAIN